MCSISLLNRRSVSHANSNTFRLGRTSSAKANHSSCPPATGTRLSEHMFDSWCECGPFIAMNDKQRHPRLPASAGARQPGAVRNSALTERQRTILDVITRRSLARISPSIRNRRRRWSVRRRLRWRTSCAPWAQGLYAVTRTPRRQPMRGADGCRPTAGDQSGRLGRLPEPCCPCLGAYRDRRPDPCREAVERLPAAA